MTKGIWRDFELRTITSALFSGIRQDQSIKQTKWLMFLYAGVKSLKSMVISPIFRPIKIGHRIFLGRGGPLVYSSLSVVGSNPALVTMYGPWANPSLAVACALRRNSPTQHPCCVGIAAE